MADTKKHVVSVTFDANMTGMEKINSSMQTFKDTSEVMEDLHKMVSVVTADFDKMGKAGNKEFESLRTQTSDLAHEVDGIHEDIVNTSEDLDKRANKYQKMVQEANGDERKLATAERYRESTERWAAERAEAVRQRSESVVSTSEMFGIPNMLGVTTPGHREKIGSNNSISANVFDIKQEQEALEGFTSQYRKMMSKWAPTMRGMITKAVSSFEYQGDQAYNAIGENSAIHAIGQTIRSGFTKATIAGAGDRSTLDQGVEQVLESIGLLGSGFGAKHIETGKASEMTGLSKKELEMIADFGISATEGNDEDSIVKRNAFKTMLRQAIVARVGARNTSLWQANVTGVHDDVIDPKDIDLAYLMKGTGLEGFFDISKGGKAAYQDTIETRNITGNMLTKEGTEELARRMAKSPMMMRAMLAKERTGRTSELTGMRLHTGGFRSTILDTRGLLQLGDNLVSEFLVRGNGQIDTIETSTDENGDPVTGQTKLMKHLMTEGGKDDNTPGENIRYNNTRYGGKTSELIASLRRGYAELEKKKKDKDYQIPEIAKTDVGRVNRLKARLRSEGTANEALSAINELNEFLTHEEYFTSDQSEAATEAVDFAPDAGVKEKQTQFLVETLFPFMEAKDKAKFISKDGVEVSSHFKLYKPQNKTFDPTKYIPRAKDEKGEYITEDIPVEWKAFTESGISRALGLGAADQNERTKLIKEISMVGVDPTKGFTEEQEQQMNMLLEDAGVYHKDKSGKLVRNDKSKYVFHVSHGQSGVTARLIERKAYNAVRNNFARAVTIPMAQEYGVLDQGIDLDNPEEFAKAVEVASKHFGDFWNNMTPDPFDEGTDYSKTKEDIPSFSKMFDNRNKRWSPGIDLFGGAIDWLHGGIDQSGHAVSFKDLLEGVRSTKRGWKGRDIGMVMPRVKVVDLATYWKRQYDSSLKEYEREFDPEERKKLVEKHRTELLKNNPKMDEEELKKQADDLAQDEIKAMGKAQLEEEGIREKGYGFDSALEGQAIVDASLMDLGAFQGRGGLAGKGTVSSQKDMIKRLAQNSLGKKAGKYDPLTKHTTYSILMPSPFGDDITLWSEYDEAGNMVAANADMIVDKSMQKDYKNFKGVFGEGLRTKLNDLRKKGKGPSSYTADEIREFKQGVIVDAQKEIHDSQAKFVSAYSSGKMGMTEDEYRWAVDEIRAQESAADKAISEGKDGGLWGFKSREDKVQEYMNDQEKNPTGSKEIAEELVNQELRNHYFKPLERKRRYIEGAWNLQRTKQKLADIDRRYAEKADDGGDSELFESLTSRFFSEEGAKFKAMHPNKESDWDVLDTKARELARAELKRLRDEEAAPVEKEIRAIEAKFGDKGLHAGDFYRYVRSDDPRKGFQEGMDRGLEKIKKDVEAEYIGEYDPETKRYLNAYGRASRMQEIEDKANSGKGEIPLSKAQIETRVRNSPDEAMSTMYAISGLYALAAYKDDKKSKGVGAQASQWIRFSPGVMKHQAEAYDAIMEDLKKGNLEGYRKHVFPGTGDDDDSFYAKGLAGPNADAFYRAHEDQIEQRVRNYKQSLLDRTMKGELVDYGTATGDIVRSDDVKKVGFDIENERFVTNAWMARNIDLGINENEKSLKAWAEMMRDPNWEDNIEYTSKGKVKSGFFKGRTRNDLLEGRSRIGVAREAFEKSAGRKFNWDQVLGIMTLAGYGKEGDADYLANGFVDFEDWDNIYSAIQRSPTGFDQLVSGLNYAAIGLGPAFAKLTGQTQGVMLNMTDMQRLAGGDWDGDMVKRLLAGKYSLKQINELRVAAGKSQFKANDKSNKELFNWVTSDPEGFRKLRESGKIGGNEASIVDDVANTIELIRQLKLFTDIDKQGLGSEIDQMEDETDLKNKVRASNESLTGIASVDLVKDINRRIQSPAQMGLTSAIGSRLSSLDLTDPKNAFWAKLAKESNRLYDVYTTQAKRPHLVDFDASNFAALSLGAEWGKMSKLTDGMWDVKEATITGKNGKKEKIFTNGQGHIIDPADLFVSEHGYGALDISKGNLFKQDMRTGGFKLDTNQFMSRSSRMNLMQAIISQTAQQRGNLDLSIGEFYKELFTREAEYEQNENGILTNDAGVGKKKTNDKGFSGGLGYGIFDTAKRADGTVGLAAVKKVMKNARALKGYNLGGQHMIMSETDRYTYQQQLIDAGNEIDDYIEEIYSNPNYGGMFKYDENGELVTEKDGKPVRLKREQAADQLRRIAGFDQIKMLIGSKKGVKGADGKKYDFSTGMTMSGMLDTLANSGNLEENQILARMLLSTIPKNQGSALVDTTYDHTAARTGRNGRSKDMVTNFSASKKAIVANAIKLKATDLLPEEYKDEVDKQLRQQMIMRKQNQAAAAEKAANAAAVAGAATATQATGTTASGAAATATQTGQQAADQAGQQAAQATTQAAQDAATAAAQTTAQAAATAAQATAQAVGAGTPGAPGTPGTPSSPNVPSEPGVPFTSDDLNKAIAAGMDQHATYQKMQQEWDEATKYLPRSRKRNNITQEEYDAWQYEKTTKTYEDIANKYVAARNQLDEQEKLGKDKVDPFLRDMVKGMEDNLPHYVEGVGIGALNSVLKYEEEIGESVGKGKASGAINQLRSIEDKKKTVQSKIDTAERIKEDMKSDINWSPVAFEKKFADENSITNFESAEKYIEQAKKELERVNTTYQTAYTAIMNNVIVGLQQQNAAIEQSITGVTKRPYASDAKSKHQRILKAMADEGTMITQQEQAIKETISSSDIFHKPLKDLTPQELEFRKEVMSEKRALSRRKKQFGKGDASSEMWEILKQKDKRDAYEYERENRDNDILAAESMKYKFDQLKNPSEVYDEEGIEQEAIRQQMMQANSELKARRKLVDKRKHDSRYKNKGSKYQVDTDAMEAKLISDEAMYGTGDERSKLWEQFRIGYQSRFENQQKLRVNTSVYDKELSHAKLDQYYKTEEERGLDNKFTQESFDLQVAKEMKSLGSEIESELTRLQNIKKKDPEYAKSLKALNAGDIEGDGAYAARIQEEMSFWRNQQNDYTSGSARKRIADRITKEREYERAHYLDSYAQESSLSRLGINRTFKTDRELELDDKYSEASIDARVAKEMKSYSDQIRAGQKRVRDEKRNNPEYKRSLKAYELDPTLEDAQIAKKIAEDEDYWKGERERFRNGDAEKEIRAKIAREQEYERSRYVDTFAQQANLAGYNNSRLYFTERELGTNSKYSKESIDLRVDKELTTLGDQVRSGLKRVDDERKTNPNYRISKAAYEHDPNSETGALARGLIEEENKWMKQREELNNGNAETAIRERIEKERKEDEARKVDTSKYTFELGKSSIEQLFKTRQETGLDQRYSKASLDADLAKSLQAFGSQIAAGQKRVEEVRENDSMYAKGKALYEAGVRTSKDVEESKALKVYEQAETEATYWDEQKKKLDEGTAEQEIRDRQQRERQYIEDHKINTDINDEALARMKLDQLTLTKQDLGLNSRYSKESIDLRVAQDMQSYANMVAAQEQRIKNIKENDSEYARGAEDLAAYPNSKSKFAQYARRINEDEAYWAARRKDYNQGNAEAEIRDRINQEIEYEKAHYLDTSALDRRAARSSVNQLYQTSRERKLENIYSEENKTLSVDKGLQSLASLIKSNEKRIKEERENNPEYEASLQAYRLERKAGGKYTDASLLARESETDEKYWQDQRNFLKGGRNGKAAKMIRQRIEKERQYAMEHEVNTLANDYALSNANFDQFFKTNRELGLDNKFSKQSIDLTVAKRMSSLAGQLRSEQKRIDNLKKTDPNYGIDAKRTEEIDKQQEALDKRRQDYNEGKSEQEVRAEVERDLEYQRAHTIDTSAMSYESSLYAMENLRGNAGAKYSDEYVQNRTRSRYLQMGQNLNQREKELEAMKQTSAYAKDEDTKERVDKLMTKWEADKTEYDKGVNSSYWDDAKKMTEQEIAGMKEASKYQDLAQQARLEKQGARYSMQAHRFNNQFLSGNIFGQVYQRMDNRREQIKVAREQIENRQYSIDAELAKERALKNTDQYDEARIKRLEDEKILLKNQDIELGNQEKGVSGIGGYLSTFGKQIGGGLLSAAVNKTMQLFKKLAQVAIQFAAQWNTAMSTVSAKSGLTGTALQELGDKIEAQATKLKVSSTALANTYAQLFSAGVDSSNIEKMAEAMTKFSTVTGQDMTKSFRQLNQIVSSGLVDNLEEVMDLLTSVSGLSNSTAADISKVMSKMSSGAITAGLSTAETTGLATFVADTLGGSASAGNDVNLILERLNALTKSGTTGLSTFTDADGRTYSMSELEALQKTTGVRFLSSDSGELLNSIDIMKNLAAEWENLSEAQKNVFASILGGASGKQSSSLTNLISGLSLDSTLLDTYINAAGSSTGTLNTQYYSLTSNIAAAKQQATSAFTDFVSNIAGGSDGWFAQVQEGFWKGITNIFGGSSVANKIDLSEAFTFNMENFQDGINALEEIKNKYEDLTGAISEKDQEDITNVITQIANAFPNLSDKIKTSVTNMEELVKLLEQLNIEKDKLIGDNAQEQSDTADYNSINEQFRKEYSSGSYAYAQNLSSTYSNAGTNWVGLARDIKENNSSMVKGIGFGQYTGNDELYSMMIEAMQYGAALHYDEFGEYAGNPDYKLFEYDKKGNITGLKRTGNYAVDEIIPSEWLEQMATGELTYETMNEDQRDKWDQAMGYASEYIQSKIQQYSDAGDTENVTKWQKVFYSFMPHIKTSSDIATSQETAISNLVDNLYTTRFGSYTTIDDVAEEYLKEQIRNYITTTYTEEQLAAPNFAVSQKDTNAIFASQSQWFDEIVNPETGEITYGDFNADKFKTGNVGEYATYQVNGYDVLGNTPEEAIEYYNENIAPNIESETMEQPMTDDELLKTVTDKITGEMVSATWGDIIKASQSATTDQKDFVKKLITISAANGMSSLDDLTSIEGVTFDTSAITEWINSESSVKSVYENKNATPAAIYSALEQYAIGANLPELKTTTASDFNKYQEMITQADIMANNIDEGYIDESYITALVNALGITTDAWKEASIDKRKDYIAQYRKKGTEGVATAFANFVPYLNDFFGMSGYSGTPAEQYTAAAEAAKNEDNIYAKQWLDMYDYVVNTTGLGFNIGDDGKLSVRSDLNAVTDESAKRAANTILSSTVKNLVADATSLEYGSGTKWTSGLASMITSHQKFNEAQQYVTNEKGEFDLSKYSSYKDDIQSLIKERYGLEGFTDELIASGDQAVIDQMVAKTEEMNQELADMQSISEGAIDANLTETELAQVEHAVEAMTKVATTIDVQDTFLGNIDELCQKIASDGKLAADAITEIGKSAASLSSENALAKQINGKKVSELTPDELVSVMNATGLEYSDITGVYGDTYLQQYINKANKDVAAFENDIIKLKAQEYQKQLSGYDKDSKEYAALVAQLEQYGFTVNENGQIEESSYANVKLTEAGSAALQDWEKEYQYDTDKSWTNPNEKYGYYYNTMQTYASASGSTARSTQASALRSLVSNSQMINEAQNILNGKSVEEAWDSLSATDKEIIANAYGLSVSDISKNKGQASDYISALTAENKAERKETLSKYIGNYKTYIDTDEETGEAIFENRYGETDQDYTQFAKDVISGTVAASDSLKELAQTYLDSGEAASTASIAYASAAEAAKKTIQETKDKNAMLEFLDTKGIEEFQSALEKDNGWKTYIASNSEATLVLEKFTQGEIDATTAAIELKKALDGIFAGLSNEAIETKLKTLDESLTSAGELSGWEAQRAQVAQWLNEQSANQETYSEITTNNPYLTQMAGARDEYEWLQYYTMYQAQRQFNLGYIDQDTLDFANTVAQYRGNRSASGKSSAENSILNTFITGRNKINEEAVTIADLERSLTGVGATEETKTSAIKSILGENYVYSTDNIEVAKDTLASRKAANEAAYQDMLAQWGLLTTEERRKLGLPETEEDFASIYGINGENYLTPFEQKTTSSVYNDDVMQSQFYSMLNKATSEEDFASMVELNTEMQAWLKTNEAAAKIYTEVKEKTTTLTKAQKDYAKELNKDTSSVNKYHKEMAKLREDIQNVKYWKDKGTYDKSKGSDDLKALASITGLSEETLAKMKDGEIVDMLDGELDDLGQQYEDKLNEVKQEYSQEALRAFETGENENGVMTYNIGGVEIVAGTIQTHGIDEAIAMAQALGQEALVKELESLRKLHGSIQLQTTFGPDGTMYAYYGGIQLSGVSGRSSSSSSSGSGKSAAEKRVERWKHKLEDRKHQITMAKNYEEYYQETGNLAQYGKELTVENQAQQNYINTLASSIVDYKKNLKNVKVGSDDWYTLTDAIQEAEEEIVSATTAIQKNNKALEENRKAMRKTRTDLEDYYKDLIEKNESTQEDLIAGTVEMEDIILEAIKARYQEEWNLQKEDLEKKKAALEDEKELINERLQARKDAEDAADEYEEIAELQKQLAIISMDSTRAAEAEEIRSQLAEKTNELAWKEAETYAETRQSELEDEATAIDEFIADEDERMEDYLADANNFASAVQEVLGGSQDEIMQWLKDNVEEYSTYLDAAQTQQVAKWLETYKKMLGITDTYWTEINSLIAGGWQAGVQYLMTTQDYINASDTEKYDMIMELKTMVDDYNSAFNTAGISSNYDKLTAAALTKLETAISGGNAQDINNALTYYEKLMTGTANSLHTDDLTYAITDVATVLEDTAPVISEVNTTLTASNKIIASSTDYIKKAIDAIQEKIQTKTGSAANGGVFNYTGKVTVHGTNDHPEYVFNEDQLKALKKIGYVPYSASIGSDAFTTSSSIGDVSIVINQAEIASDIDVQKLAEQVGEQFVQQISVQGYRTGRY